MALPLAEFDRLSHQTPLIGTFRPSSPYTVNDLHRAGGVPSVLRILEPLLNLDLPSVAGRSLAQIAAQAPDADGIILRSLDNPIASKGGLAVLFGNLAPRGAVVKTSAVAPVCAASEAQRACSKVRKTCALR